VAGHKLIFDDVNSDAGYDDNLSDNDRIIKIDGGSEYGGSEQSFFSIRQYESSDGDDF